MWLGFDMIIDLAADKFGFALTNDFDDQHCALSMIYPRLLNKSVVCKL
jgi:hypothetical protein